MRHRGFTLLELLISLTIVSLVLGFAWPAWTALHRKSQATLAVRQLVSAVHLARNTALTRHQRVTLCPSRDGQRCGGDWKDTLVIFTGNDTEIAEGELISRLPASSDNLIEWRAFRPAAMLQFQSNGATYGYNGTFIICPPDGDARYARALVLNKAGRLRIAADMNNDGVVDISTGEAVACRHAPG